jgi:hypothetical protein
MEKKYLGQLLTFEFEYTSEIVNYSGYLLDYNEEWVLLKHNTDDYVIDGYIILKNKHITRYKRDEPEKFTQKILDLKGEKPNSDEIIPIIDLKEILLLLSERFGIFQFNMKTNSSCWLGTVKKIIGSNLKIDYLTPRAKWVRTMPPFKLGNIRTIEFDTDYINSLMLVAKKRR